MLRLHSAFSMAVPVFVVGLIACNSPSRRAEKALDLCQDVENRLVELMIAFDHAKPDDAEVVNLKLRLREAHAQMRGEAQGDQLVLRCARRMDEVNQVLNRLEENINQLRLELIGHSKSIAVIGQQVSLFKSIPAARVEAERRLQVARIGLEETTKKIQAEEVRLKPIEDFRQTLAETRTKILELLPPR